MRVGLEIIACDYIKGLLVLDKIKLAFHQYLDCIDILEHHLRLKRPYCPV